MARAMTNLRTEQKTTKGSRMFAVLLFACQTSEPIYLTFSFFNPTDALA